MCFYLSTPRSSLVSSSPLLPFLSSPPPLEGGGGEGTSGKGFPHSGKLSLTLRNRLANGTCDACALNAGNSRIALLLLSTTSSSAVHEDDDEARGEEEEDDDDNDDEKREGKSL